MRIQDKIKARKLGKGVATTVPVPLQQGVVAIPEVPAALDV
jgi:hypothetical protein